MLAPCLNVNWYVTITKSIKIASSGTGVVDVDDVWCLIDKTHGPVSLYPGLILGELKVAFSSLQRLPRTNTVKRSGQLWASSDMDILGNGQPWIQPMTEPDAVAANTF